jgi:NADH-quinone oxidoreductase subunit M
MNLLDIVLAIPLIGFLVLLLMPRAAHGAIRAMALAFSLVAFAASVGLAIGFDTKAAGEQFVTDFIWVNSPQIHYHVALDGLSLWLVILATFLTPVCVLISWKSIQSRVKEYFAFLMLLEVGLAGVFAAQDLFLFYVFWEVSLVPMYFLIGIWGHTRRIYAALKFFLYTFAASVLMLTAIIYVYNHAGTFNYPDILAMLQSGRLSFNPQQQMLLFLAFFVAFAVKVPIFPLHTWLPDAHVEAPTAGSVMLASVMLKMGTYGLARFCLPMFPGAARTCAPWIVTLAIIGIIYGALVAMVQPNMKKLVAYSSVSHLGFVVLGIFSFTQMGMDGAVYQMLNHGISTGALFVMVGFLYERRHSLEIADYGGVASAAPWLSTAFMITMLASMGLPTLNNFDPFRLLHAMALSTPVLWRDARRGAAACLRPEAAGMGRHPAADRHDGLDGHVFPIVPAFGETNHGADSGPDAGECAVSGEAAGDRGGGGACPLIWRHPPRNTSVFCRRSYSSRRARC